MSRAPRPPRGKERVRIEQALARGEDPWQIAEDCGLDVERVLLVADSLDRLLRGEEDDTDGADEAVAA